MSSSAPLPRVLKFGGAALSDGPAVRRACRIIAEHGGERPVVIVSALEGVTALLEELAEGRAEVRTLQIRHRSLLNQLELSSELLDPFFRELAGLIASFAHTDQVDAASRDHLLSFGERMSSRIVASALRASSQFATPVDAHDLGLVIESRRGEPRMLPGAADKIRQAIAEVPGIPVVTGFLAADERGNLTTLGSNGSDLTALFVGEAIGAGEVQLWKSVAGIQTADPRWIPEAQTLPELGFDEVAELARCGARVIHYGVARVASRAGLSVSLRDVRDPNSAGTRLVDVTRADGALIVVHRDGLSRADLELDGPAQLGALLAASDESKWASISLVGPAASANEELRAQVFADLNGADLESIEIRPVPGSSSFTLLVASSALPRALPLVHALATHPSREGEILRSAHL